MALPVVAIVGRPNVGKSSLFNALVRRRTSIVEPTAGVTRDRVTAVCDLDDVYFELVDTGGHGMVDRDDLNDHVERQIRYAIDQADLILFVVDGREGINPLDTATAELLRACNRTKRREPKSSGATGKMAAPLGNHNHQPPENMPGVTSRIAEPHRDEAVGGKRPPPTQRVQLLANKVDEPKLEAHIGEFSRLGFGEPLAVSAVARLGLTDLRKLIVTSMAPLGGETPADPVMKIALVGKRNAGKSCFINALAGEDRVIVSEVPGTTRDSIDVRFEKDGRTIVAIDTAGVRKKKRIADSVEFYAHTRATDSISRADVVLLLIDATVPVGQVDQRLASVIAGEYKPCVLVVNKWDLAKGRASVEDYGDYLAAKLPEVRYAPVAFTTALSGRNCFSTIDLAGELFKQSHLRVNTGMLNQVLQQAVGSQTPKSKRGRKPPKFFYATQVATGPPTLVIFVNGPRLVTPQYERFLVNRFREALPFREIPIRLLYRARRGRDAAMKRA